MNLTKSAELVTFAEQTRPTQLTKSSGSFNSAIDVRDRLLQYKHWAQALNEANLHITVRPEEIEAAKDAYHEIATHLEANLSWPPESILILPQGSASTRTLIRSPNGGEKFDIDAVCQVDISRITAADPMGFFGSIGRALEKLDAKPKKRCWYIPFPNERFYLEFTPSVPIANVSIQTLQSMAPRYHAANRYANSALAVVDTPTRSWKTSNPPGMTLWVDDTAKRQLIRAIVIEKSVTDRIHAGVTPVPDQTVEITDTLRVAIRLFKRHRDMCVKRGTISADYKTISIIIVTLLTRCYEGFADLNRSFDHPVELLIELAELMPYLVSNINNQYQIDNPTVEGENFAEKWNEPGSRHYRTFITWCEILLSDLKSVLALTNPLGISKRVREVFGIPAPTISGGGLPKFPPVPVPKPTPPSEGLA